METATPKRTTCCAAVSVMRETALDLSRTGDTELRLRHLLDALYGVFPYEAAAVLRIRDRQFHKAALRGFAPFAEDLPPLSETSPRLRMLIGSPDPVYFAPDSPLPDPFVDRLSVQAGVGEPHGWLGCALRTGDRPSGVLVLLSRSDKVFRSADHGKLAVFAALAAAGLPSRITLAAERPSRPPGRRTSSTAATDPDRLLGDGPAMRRLREEIRRVAPSRLPVLILGETGTGKELVARALHARSDRSAGPLVHVNCAALPEAMAEGELFGHIRGAFTGADATRPGKFEAADGGTLFLDEIGELPPTVQPKLLRALQFGEIQRLGSDREIRVDVRVVAATNRDLRIRTQRGEFREDLFHRIDGVTVRAPALREHPEDIALIANHLLAIRCPVEGAGKIRISDDALLALTHHPWPGNVRELEHVLSRAVLRAWNGVPDTPVTIAARHLDFNADAGPLLPEPPSLPELKAAPPESFKSAVKSFKRALILQYVTAAEGNWALAARNLGLHRSNLYRTAKRLGLKSPEGEA